MNANFEVIKANHVARLKAAEDLMRDVNDECEDLERWHASCHIFHSQVEEVRRATENNLRSRSSEADKQALLKDLHSRTTNTLQEAEKLKKCADALTVKSKFVQDDMDKENELYARIDENVMPKTFRMLNQPR